MWVLANWFVYLYLCCPTTGQPGIILSSLWPDTGSTEGDIPSTLPHFTDVWRWQSWNSHLWCVYICNYVIDVHILSFISPQSNIALMLHSCKEYALSVSYLEHALKLNTKYVNYLCCFCCYGDTQVPWWWEHTSSIKVCHHCCHDNLLL